MKQRKPETIAPIKSTLAYDASFKLSYLKPMYWSTWTSIVLLWVVKLMPCAVQDALANIMGDLLRNMSAKRRRIARKNLQLCFPQLTETAIKELIRQNYRHQARSILHLGVLWWSSMEALEKRIVMKGQQYIDEALDNGRGAIIMPAHSMGLEAAVSAVAMRYFSSGVFKPLKNKLIDWFVANGRMRHGGYVYAREAGLRPIIKDARAGSTTIYLSDEDLGAERSLFAPFFGVEKASVPVLGRLAKSCRADVFPCMTCYDEKTHQYIVHILPALKNFPSGDDYTDTLAMNQALEEAIKICPSQYFWILKLFKTRPEGESRFY
ncbi:Lipid A biosynthesis lauroyl acyltransferase [hydrothermal vent metagenome]|uniref:Lipid A biosynthesis lauroyl acyltransferase n=1 Tax=hydrothermal vent metagenome TaxID=652676 RepID=A0A3B0YWQ1_9ZZZZ